MSFTRPSVDAVGSEDKKMIFDVIKRRIANEISDEEFRSFGSLLTGIGDSALTCKLCNSSGVVVANDEQGFGYGFRCRCSIGMIDRRRYPTYSGTAEKRFKV